MEQRTCPVCREPFTPKTSRQRFCPPSDERRDQGLRSRCAKAYENAKSRGSLDDLLARPWGEPVQFDCANCGAHCVPGENAPEHATKFCGKSCKRNWHRLHVEGGTYRWQRQHRAKRRREKARDRLANAGSNGKPRLFVEGQCSRCGKRFTTLKPHLSLGHYCSRTCQRQMQKDRRRARKRQALVEEVWRPILFERDNWTCQLCGDPVDPEVEYPDPMCASIDHIVPLSTGGEHSYANTQLAHSLCNSLKGARESGSMMFAAQTPAGAG